MKWTATVQAAHRIYGLVSREPEPPFARAYWHAHSLFSLVNSYGQNPSPLSAKDLQDLVLLEQRLRDLHALTRNLIVRLELRFHGPNRRSRSPLADDGAPSAFSADVDLRFADADPFGS